MSTYPVRLYRQSPMAPWGFRLQGGADLHTPVIVQRVFAGSSAEGQLQRGDILLGIENYDATCLLHGEAQDLVNNSGTALSLHVKRSQGLGRMTRGQSVGPLARQTAFGDGGYNSSSYQQPAHRQQPLYSQQQQQQAWKQPTYQLQPQQQQQQQHQQWGQGGYRKDQYNVYVSGGGRQRSESAAQHNHENSWQGWHQQPQPQPQSYYQARPVMETANASTANYAANTDRMHHHHHHQEPQHQHQPQHQQPSYAGLAAQRSFDDEDVDYSFTRQSVAERMRKFMQPQSAGYHSVPRSSGYSSSAANQYRQKRSGYGDPSRAGQLAEFGWSPSPDKLWRQRPVAASRAAFEQSSYLPSQGIGPPDSPTVPRGRPGNRIFGGGRGGGGGGSGGLQRHSVSGSFTRPQRYSSMQQIGNGAGEQPYAYNSRQYNTPIGMYSRQNVNNAFEGQTGIRVGQSQPGYNTNGGGQEPQPAYTQSQVYKLVHEQEHMRHRQPNSYQQHQAAQPAKLHHSPAAAWATAHQESNEIDEPGVSDF